MATEIVSSKMPADNSAGRNGDSRASSQVPGDPDTTIKGFSTPVDITGLKAAENQKRDINGSDAGKKFAPVQNNRGTSGPRK